MRPDDSLEQAARKRGYALVCGCDEAGAGPLMGPVCAGAVILPEGCDIPGLDDSKKLTEKKREALYGVITERAIAWAVASVSAAQIDATDILSARIKAMELAMIENLQREDLNPMEEAAGFQSLIESYHMTQEEAAQRVGKSRSAVTNALRLLGLTPSVRKLVEEGKLSAGHARALLGLKAAEAEKAAQAVVEGGLSVRQTEALAKRLSLEKPEKAPAPKGIDYAAEAQKELSSKLGRGVRIVTGRKKGRIELEYYGMDDLNDLLEALALLKHSRKGPNS